MSRNQETETMKDVLVALFEFQCNANGADFRRIFGERLGPHLFGQFSNKHGHNLLTFANTLDSRHFELLASHTAAAR